MRIMMVAQHEGSLQEPGRLGVRSFGRPEQGSESNHIVVCTMVSKGATKGGEMSDGY